MRKFSRHNMCKTYPSCMCSICSFFYMLQPQWKAMYSLCSSSPIYVRMLSQLHYINDSIFLTIITYILIVQHGTKISDMQELRETRETERSINGRVQVLFSQPYMLNCVMTHVSKFVIAHQKQAQKCFSRTLASIQNIDASELLSIA